MMPSISRSGRVRAYVTAAGEEDAEDDWTSVGEGSVMTSDTQTLGGGSDVAAADSKRGSRRDVDDEKKSGDKEESENTAAVTVNENAAREAEELTPYGPYDFKSIEKRLYIDVAEQYDFSQVKNRINVPYKPLRRGNRKHLVVPGMEGKTQGVGDSTSQLYMHSFDAQVDRVGGLMDKLFK
jgi:hypothetical protein